VTVHSAVAFEAASVDASITTSVAVPAETPVISQRIPLVAVQAEHAAGVVDPATSASAAVLAAM